MRINTHSDSVGFVHPEKKRSLSYTPAAAAAVGVLPRLKCGCMINTCCGTHHKLLNGVRSALFPFASVTSRCLHLLSETEISAFDTELLRLIRLLRIVNNELSRVHTAHTMCFAHQSHWFLLGMNNAKKGNALEWKLKLWLWQINAQLKRTMQGYSI